MEKAFKGVNHGKGQIDLTHLKSNHVQPLEQLPVEIHLKEDGSITDEPSFCIVSKYGEEVYFGQLSLKMFNEGLADVGYEIVRREK